MPTDLNSLATAIVGKAVEDVPKPPPPDKDPAAVALGRRGGLKGGTARAQSLSAEQRKDSAKKAAAARWGTREPVTEE